jgi:hypothetical protein
LNKNTLKYWGLCLTAAEKNSTISMIKGNYAPTISLLYSFDGKSWHDFIPN